MSLPCRDLPAPVGSLVPPIPAARVQSPAPGLPHVRSGRQVGHDEAVQETALLRRVGQVLEEVERCLLSYLLRRHLLHPDIDDLGQHLIGWHEHHGETEPYYVLKGEGDFIDSDRSVVHVTAGDVCLIEEGCGHSIENNSDAVLELMALIYNVEAKQ